MRVPVRDGDKIIRVSSYVPIYREPPSDAAGRLLFSDLNQIKACNLGITMPVKVSGSFAMSFRFEILDAVLENYLRWHKHYVQVRDMDAIRILYGSNLVYQFRQRWGWYANLTTPFVHIDIHPQVMPPDDLLDFTYLMATYDINERLMGVAISYFSDYALKRFLKKRAKDPRYKFIQPCMTKPAYWRNQDYWNGFKAGLLIDMAMFLIASGPTRRHIWDNFSTNNNTELLYKAVKLDPRVVSAFSDELFVEELWNLLVSNVSCVGANLRYYGVPEIVTKRIDRMINEPEQLRKELTHA